MGTPIQILSRVIIKPSSPTPLYQRKMLFSYLDQLVNPNMYIPIIFFYQANETSSLASSNLSHVSQSLKRSLSDILTSFYPFAGRIEDQSFVDCNDTGVEFIEARAQTYLADSMHEDNNDNLHWYAPLDHGKETLLVVKLTSFECGGISIGICFAHQLADCASIMAFLDAWAMTCRGETNFAKLHFNLADHFPPKELSRYSESLPSNKENLVTKRFLFDEGALMVLKEEATSPLVMNPTKVEVVSTFISKHVIEVAQCRDTSPEMILRMSHAVNLRTRMTNPPHPMENAFGNCVMVSTALYNTKLANVTSNLYQDLVSKLRSSIKKINSNYITEAQTGDNYLRDFFEVPSMLAKGKSVEWCVFSSWCKFPVYEVDYGWGNPTWVCTTALPVKNGVLLMDTKCGTGIEAWICMEKGMAEMLDTKIQLISSKCT